MYKWQTKKISVSCDLFSVEPLQPLSNLPEKNFEPEEILEEQYTLPSAMDDLYNSEPRDTSTKSVVLLSDVVIVKSVMSTEMENRAIELMLEFMKDEKKLRIYILFHICNLLADVLAPLMSQSLLVEQNLDHFNESEPRTWMQYFAYNKQYATNDSVNSLQLGGEAIVNADIITDLLVSNIVASGAWARQFGANLYALEHRFYGSSQPFGNQTKPDLRFLISEQALADAAVFIKTTNHMLNITNPKWVVFGGSYAGNLAAWMRMKYPDLVSGAVASSAPVQATLDFKEYFPVVAAAIKDYGTENCTDNIRRYFSEVLTEEGRKRLGVKKENETFSFLFHLVAMTSSQNDDFQHEYIKYICDNFKKLPGDISNSDGPLEYYSRCNNDVTIKNYMDRWYWQKCTEFGYFKTTPIDGGIFDDATLTLRGFIKNFCVDKFPEANLNQSTIQAAVDKTNGFYGGNKNFNATNVVFVNGSEDPWHVLSVYDTPNDSIKSILVQGTSHCGDYGAEQENDPRALKNARQRVKHEIDLWLGLKEIH